MCAHGSLVVTKVGKSMVRRRPWGEDREDKNNKVMKADRTICRAAMGPARVQRAQNQVMDSWDSRRSGGL